MNRQRKLSKNLGKDTHTRSVENNQFQKQSRTTFEILTGEVFLNQPEPAFSQNAVSVRLSKGGIVSGVPIPGAFIDPVTGNLHGSYEGFIPGQMVSLGFVDGNSAAPIILNRHPYQGVGNTLTKSAYKIPMFLAGFTPFDVVMGHFSGSRIGLYTGGGTNGALPGSIGIDAFTECNITANTNILLNALVSAEVKANIAKLTGTAQAIVSAAQVKIDGSATVEINGNTKQFVTWTEFNTAFQAYIGLVNTFFGTKLDGSGTPGTLVCDITTAKTVKTLTGG